MSSRRNLKKSINSIMDLLYTDCIFYKVFVVDADIEAADKIIARIADVHCDLLKRISVNEGRDAKGRVKAYYKKLNANIKEQADTIGKEIATLL